LSYDAAGNLIDDGVNHYVYDARNQLIQITQGGVTTASFTYDVFGRRLSKTIGTVTTSYRYDGDNPIEETTAGQASAILSGPGIDERYGRDEAGGRAYYLTDNLGSVVALANGSGTVTAQYAYEPYGEVSATGSSDNPYQYTGRENDDTALYYYRARYYSLSLKRFISEDPIGLVAGLNSYTYAGANPIRFNDPTGLLFGLNVGEGYGDSAAQYWADKQVQTGNWLYAIPGSLAALWTPCTSNKTFGTLLFGYAAGWAPTVLPNFPVWAQNPFWYEIGQKTVPTAIYGAMSGLSAAERGRVLVYELGWWRTLLPSAGPWSTTLSAGPTPGGWLGTVGLGLASWLIGSDCDCQ
jgi:RHS repeat-associated protein